VALSIREVFILYVAWSCLLGSLLLGWIVYGIERGAGGSAAYVDCLFHVASAASSTGLITLDTSALQAGSNAVIFLSMLVFANTLLVTQVPVVLRICRVRASIAARDAAAQELAAREAALGAAGAAAAAAAEQAEAEKRAAAMIEMSNVTVVVSRSPRARLKFTAASATGASDMESPRAHARAYASKRSPSLGGGAGALPPANALVQPAPAAQPPEAAPAMAAPDADVAKYAADVAAHERHKARLAAFLAQHDYLGYYWCIALALLYYCTIVFAGFVAFCAWGAASASARALLERNATPAGSTSLPWFAAYHSLSLFTNTGMIMIPDNMVQFGRDKFFVVTSGVIAVLGFSLYPLGFRVFVMVAHAALPARWKAHKAAVGDLLAHPRKYTSHLFSANGTIALTLASIGAQVLLFAVFLASDFNSAYFITTFPRPEDRAMNGWFSSVMVCVCRWLCGASQSPAEPRCTPRTNTPPPPRLSFLTL
jgi:cell division protein FtsB